jgi:hypothetical protein
MKSRCRPIVQSAHLQPDGVIQCQYRADLHLDRRSDRLFEEVNLTRLLTVTHLQPSHPGCRLDVRHAAAGLFVSGAKSGCDIR